MSALRIRDLRVTYPGAVHALDGVDLDVAEGTTLALLGESGSGKSTFARTLLGLNDSAATSGQVLLNEIELTALDARGWRALRWQRIAMAFQATTALDPLQTVEEQIAEPLALHGISSGRAAHTRTAEVLDLVGLGDTFATRRPGEMSGGQRRLAMLAVALACDPEVLVVDEPTAGLDPLARARVVELLQRLRKDGTTLVLLTHDVSVAAAVADHVGLLYRGWLAEHGPAATVLEEPRSPYGTGLLNAVPTLWNRKELRGIRVAPAGDRAAEVGCPFASRCHQVVDECGIGRPVSTVPTAEEGERRVACVRGGVVDRLVARDITKTYRLTDRSTVRALTEVSLTVRAGEVLGVVGTNGAGKSTMALLLAGLVEPDAGSVALDGTDLASVGRADRRSVARRLQLVQQDPYEALSPRLSVTDLLAEPLAVQRGDLDRAARHTVITDALGAVRLPVDDAFLARHPHELSGGQLQRISLARALVLEPEVLVLDEPVAMLDPSEQAEMLQLLKALQVARGMSLVVVSHDLAVIVRIADRVVVLDGGRVVESGTGEALLRRAVHPTTRALLRASGHDVTDR